MRYSLQSLGRIGIRYSDPRQVRAPGSPRASLRPGHLKRAALGRKGRTDMAQQYETLAEAAERTGISQRTLRRRIAAGDLPAFVSGRRILRVRPQDVDELLRPLFTYGRTA